MSENIVPFKEQTVKKFFQQSCSNPDIKVPSVTLQMSAEMIRVFIVEAACRSLEQIAEPDYPVETDHLERILTQLLLDFK